MKVQEAALSGIIGTTLMTVFSYLTSSKKGLNFREPELLGKMAENLVPASKPIAEPIGWIAHYLTGEAFATTQQLMLDKLQVKPSLKAGLVAGVAAGLVGIAIWEVASQMHPEPPKLPKKRLFPHLFVAHLIFSTAASLTVRAMRDSHKGAKAQSFSK